MTMYSQYHYSLYIIWPLLQNKPLSGWYKSSLLRVGVLITLSGLFWDDQIMFLSIHNYIHMYGEKLNVDKNQRIFFCLYLTKLIYFRGCLINTMTFFLCKWSCSSFKYLTLNILHTISVCEYWRYYASRVQIGILFKCPNMTHSLTLDLFNRSYFKFPPWFVS